MVSVLGSDNWRMAKGSPTRGACANQNHCSSTARHRAASVPCTRVVFVGIQLGGSEQTNIWKLQCDKWPVALVAVSWFKMCSNQPVSHNRRNLRQSIHRQLLFLIYASTQLLVGHFWCSFDMRHQPVVQSSEGHCQCQASLVCQST